MRSASLYAVIAAALSTTAAAQTEREHDSHEHGSATLNVALDGNTVVVEMETPWANIVGFEHAPSTDDQKAQVSDALDQLNQPGSLFTFQGADCVVKTTDIEDSMAAADGHDDHDDHDDHKDADGDHDDHKDEHRP